VAKLTLKFEERVLGECAVGEREVRIGRLPDNTLVIDNPAVSGHHARVSKVDDKFVIEDLQSTNGIFINERRVTRQVLTDGDVVLVGKHTLVFTAAGGGEASPAGGPKASMPEIGGTVVLDTQRQKDLLAKAGAAGRGKETAAKPAARHAMLHVLSGHTDLQEYSLSAQTSLIGKADNALVRLRGWFKPSVAVAIARKGDAYTATRVGGKPTVNGEPLDRRDLKDGDVLDVSGLTLEFRQR
jgi:pSer/pThr/pTyr-binding forkhead associated (FHA) protein